METKASLPHSQEPATSPYPEPDWSSPCPPSHFLKIHLIILPSMPRSSKWSLSLSCVSPPKPCERLSSPPFVLHSPPISFSYLSPQQYWLSSTDHKALHDAVFSTPPPRYLSLLSPNIPLNTPLSNTHSLHSSLNVSNQVSHPYKTTGKIIFLYTLMFIFLDSKLEYKDSALQAFPDFRVLLISFWIEIWFVMVVPNYLNSSPLSRELLSIFILWLYPAFWSPDMTM